MKPINLLPDHYLQARRRRRWLIAAASGAVVALILGAGWLVVASRQIDRLDQRIAQLQQQAAPRHQHRQRLSELRREQDRLARTLGQYQSLEAPLPISSVLGVLEQTMPASVALTDITCVVPPVQLPGTAATRTSTRQEAAPAPSRIDLSFEGIATAETLVGQFVSALAGQPLFQDVTLAYCRHKPGDIEGVYIFRLELHIPLDQHRFIVERGEVARAH